MSLQPRVPAGCVPHGWRLRQGEGHTAPAGEAQLQEETWPMCQPHPSSPPGMGFSGGSSEGLCPLRVCPGAPPAKLMPSEPRSGQDIHSQVCELMQPRGASPNPLTQKWGPWCSCQHLPESPSIAPLSPHHTHKRTPLFAFSNGMCPGEQRERWDPGTRAWLPKTSECAASVQTQGCWSLS